MVRKQINERRQKSTKLAEKTLKYKSPIKPIEPIDAPKNDSKLQQSLNKRKSGLVQKKVLYKDSERLLSMNKATMREIRRLQARTDRMIPLAPFLRLVREILFMYGGDGIRIQRTALDALQEACELYMTQFFQDSYLLTFHCNRVTLMVKDMQLTRRLRGVNDIINH